MDHLVENTSEYNENIFIEYMSKTIRKGYRVTNLIVGVFIIGYAIYHLNKYTFLSQKSLVIYALLICLGIFSILWVSFFAAIVWGKRAYKQQIILNNNAIPSKKITFYQDRLEAVSSNGAMTVFEYQNVIKEIISKNLYILIFKGKVTAFMRKDSFTKGSLEEARALVSVYRSKKTINPNIANVE